MCSNTTFNLENCLGRGPVVERGVESSSVNWASTGCVVQREFCQDSVVFESIFAKIKIKIDVKIVVISEGWEWDSIRLLRKKTDSGRFLNLDREYRVSI